MRRSRRGGGCAGSAASRFRPRAGGSRRAPRCSPRRRPYGPAAAQPPEPAPHGRPPARTRASVTSAARSQMMRLSKVGEDCTDLVVREHDRLANPAFHSHHVLAPAERLLPHRSVEEVDRAECRILSRGRDAPTHREVGEERLHLPLPHRRRVPTTAEADKAANPVDACLLRPVAVVPSTNCSTHPLVEARAGHDAPPCAQRPGAPTFNDLREVGSSDRRLLKCLVYGRYSTFSSDCKPVFSRTTFSTVSGRPRPTMDFEWDSAKAESNARKHGVSFSEASTVLGDPLELVISDPDHSEGEYRYLSLGRSSKGRLLVVSYTEREQNRIRIISARPATSAETSRYESNT